MAVKLDRTQQAEMSCVAGVGGDVNSLVRTAQSNRKILVLDGCPLHCARHCLARHGVSPDVHIDLSKSGVKKRFHEDATPEEADRVWTTVIKPAVNNLTNIKSSEALSDLELIEVGGAGI